MLPCLSSGRSHIPFPLSETLFLPRHSVLFPHTLHISAPASPPLTTTPLSTCTYKDQVLLFSYFSALFFHSTWAVFNCMAVASHLTNCGAIGKVLNCLAHHCILLMCIWSRLYLINKNYHWLNLKNLSLTHSSPVSPVIFPVSESQHGMLKPDVLGLFHCTLCSVISNTQREAILAFSRARLKGKILSVHFFIFAVLLMYLTWQW